jgi:hypothetical protein
MDWLIFHLVGDVLTHYFYGVQCKLSRYVRNKKQEGIVALAMLRARNIPNSKCPITCHDGEDIVFVTSINHTPKVWTIHILSFEWP